MNDKEEQALNKNAEYWAERFNILNDELHKDATEKYQQIEYAFDKALYEMQNDIEKWYNRIAVNNNLSMKEAKTLLNKNELEEFHWNVKEYIKYGQDNVISQAWNKQLENASAKYHITKLEALKMSTQHTMEKAFGNQLDMTDKMARDTFTKGSYKTMYEMQKGLNIGFDVAKVNENKLNKIISKPWTVDNRSFSDRIWGDKAKMITELHSELIKQCSTGKNCKKAIMHMMSFVSPNVKNAEFCAKRIILTERAYFTSISRLESLQNFDTKQYKITAIFDMKTSQICRDMDSQVFNIDEYAIGKTAPPFHPFCRTDTIPYINNKYTIDDMKKARGSDGEIHEIPANMSYREWEKTFLKDANENDLIELTDSEISDIIKSKLIDSINDKSKSYLDSNQQKELIDILSNHNGKTLNLYDNMSNNFTNNDYHVKNAGWYSPSEKRVVMDINNPDKEKHLKNGRTAGWETKFHEEFHQLDHLLQKTEMSRYSKEAMIDYDRQNGTNFASHSQTPIADLRITNIKTEFGNNLINSIETDIINQINLAIKSSGGSNQITSLSEVNDSISKLFMQYLGQKYLSGKERTQIGIFTDAIGLASVGKISNNVFWGHSLEYNKDRGKNGATSETWATFGGLYYTADNQTKEIVKKLIPNTWNTLMEKMEDVLDYAETNEIIY